MSLKAENKLRHFTSEDDLFDSCDNEVILAWVNELVENKEKSKAYRTRRNLRQKIMVKTLKGLLQPDELERIEEEVSERMEGE